MFDIGEVPRDAHQYTVHILHLLLKSFLMKYQKSGHWTVTHWETLVAGVVDIVTLQLHRFQVLSFGRVETVTAIIPSTKTLMTEPEPSPVVDLGVF